MGSSRLSPRPALPGTPRSERGQLLCLQDGAQPTWPSTSRNEEIIDSKRLVTARFKEACGQQLPPGPGGAASTDTCAPCALAQNPACLCVCVCVCHPSACLHHACVHVRAMWWQNPSICRKVRVCAHPCPRPRTHAHMYICRQEDGSSQHRHKRTRLAWLHRLCSCSHAQRERGARTRVLLPPVTQPVSFQKIRFGKDSW